MWIHIRYKRPDQTEAQVFINPSHVSVERENLVIGDSTGTIHTIKWDVIKQIDVLPDETIAVITDTLLKRKLASKLMKGGRLWHDTHEH